MEEENKRLWDTYLSLVKKEYSDHANNKRKGKQRRNQKHEEDSESINGLRRIKEQEQLYLLAQNELSDVNIPEYLKEHLKEYVHRDAQALEDYLCHEDLLIYSKQTTHKYGPGALLNTGNCEAFFAQFEDQAFQEFLENMFFHRKLERHLLFCFSRAFRYVSQVLEASIPGKPKLIQSILPWCVLYPSSLCDPG